MLDTKIDMEFEICISEEDDENEWTSSEYLGTFRIDFSDYKNVETVPYLYTSPYNKLDRPIQSL